MATSVRTLIAARKRGDRESLRALAVVLAQRVVDTPVLSADPAELWAEVENRGAELPGTWQEVRAARDHGELTEAEYDYLSAAVEALTLEKETGDV